MESLAPPNYTITMVFRVALQANRVLTPAIHDLENDEPGTKSFGNES
jgi:hypothetical protein